MAQPATRLLLEAEKGSSGSQVRRSPHKIEIMKNMRWKRILLATGLGTLVIFTAVTAYREYQVRTQGWCVRFYPDGSRKALYGNDCWK